ncbi:hypothetical protein [Streptomyces sp. TLI_146]|uniref:hypothetical protein n=1 Tax=Streptomyces sp. TLI_146 TaxID=1938858 RepID=UPI000C71272B|nr:hypothetical protein [Streptomyces sp. TLI_146]PKV82624.1 hypothetical protein BX283_0063 [Streptomyces sp. TLI_146]
MTTTPRSPQLLVLSTVMLAVAGIALLSVPDWRGPLSEPTAPTGHATTGRSSVRSASPSSTLAPDTSDAATSPRSSPTATVSVSALPPHGEGLGGDAVIQGSLESAWPADLAPADERVLLDAGRALLRADTTGLGRAQWPTVFAASGQALAPALSTARWRVQAAIARRNGAADRAVVHLVWAAVDRAGTFRDGRITNWHFTRTLSKEEGSTWIPQPRT